MNKNSFIAWLKAQQAFFEENPVLYIDEWLTFAQQLQRNIHDAFMVTACHVTMRYSNIFDGKAIDIEVWRKERPGDTEFELFKCVTLKSEFNVFGYEVKCQRDNLNKFINYLIKKL